MLVDTMNWQSVLLLNCLHWLMDRSVERDNRNRIGLDWSNTMKTHRNRTDKVHQSMRNGLQTNFDRMWKRRDHNCSTKFPRKVQAQTAQDEQEAWIELVMRKNCMTWIFLQHDENDDE